MNRIQSMENYLHFFADIYKQNPKIQITENSIYHYLVRDRETKHAIAPFHQKWINDFKNTPNIKVFVAEDWNYFCQFTNIDPSKVGKEIKLYIPVDAKHIDKAANDIFNYLASHNINHMSKIGKDERRDNIVVRLQDEKDLEPFRTFIHQNQNIKDGLIETNPFSMNDGIIGFAADGKLSYNDVTTKYIENYLIEKRKQNKLNQVSHQDFLLYCSNIYSKTFDYGNSETIKEFMTKFGISPDLNEEQLISTLNNYREVSSLLLTSIQTNDLNKFKEHVADIKDKDKIEVEKNRIKLSLNSKLNPIKQYIEAMIEKHGYNQAVANIQGYIKTRNANLVTRDHNLRSILNSYSQEDLVKGIETVNKLLKIDDRYKKDNQIINVPKKEQSITPTDIIDISTTDTVKKLYAPTDPILFQQIKQKYISVGLKQIIENKDYSAFTNTNNARHNMMKLDADSICAELVKGTILIYNASDKRYFNKTNMPPTTGSEAITFIMDIVNKQGPSSAYQTIEQFSNIRDLLIDSYASFVSTTTKEDRDELINGFDDKTKTQLTTISNLQSYLISQNKKPDNYGGK